MNNKIILALFTLLSITTAIIIVTTTVVSLYMIEIAVQPVYNINVYQQTNNTYSTYNEPKPAVEVNKPKPVAKPAVKQTSDYNNSDVKLLAQLIHAEAKGEPFNGKVAVGNVVLNRVKSKEFPSTIKGVIYQPRQFQPVSNGAINNEPSDEAIKAARTAMNTNLIGNALYFYNPDIATDSWIKTRKVTITIGDHSFAL